MAEKYDFSNMFFNAEIKPIPNLQAELKFEQYLILYNDNCYFHTNNAVSVKDCLIQFLAYTGHNVPLIRKALNGMETEKDMVDLINEMTDEHISYIYKIDKQIYGMPKERGGEE